MPMTLLTCFYRQNTVNKITGESTSVAKICLSDRIGVFKQAKNFKKGSWICVALHCEKLASEALRYGSHSCYTANSPYLPLPRSIHQTTPPV